MSKSVRQFMYMSVVALLVLGLGRAAMFHFREKEDAFRKGCRDELAKLGINRNAAKSKYPTPEIHMVSSGCLLPGQTGEVVVKGKFPPGTKVLIENDNIEVVKESLTAGEYRASIKVAPGIGPQNADIKAISPVTCITAQHSNALHIQGKYEWVLESGNGWKIVAKSPANKTCGGSEKEDNYEMAFYRKGESAPFEKRSATLDFSMWNQQNYQFRVNQGDQQMEASQQDMMALMQKMGNPNISDAEREAIMKKIETMQAAMMANVSKMTDPNFIKAQEAKKLEFGCEYITLEAQGGNAKGEMRCSQKVGSRIPVTGTMRLVGR